MLLGPFTVIVFFTPIFRKTDKKDSKRTAEKDTMNDPCLSMSAASVVPASCR